MAGFMQDLWEAVFTAGPTPTLLLATNLTFGALQMIFAALLAMTYSIHFAILSVLCAGLWWSINWFAQELKAAQAKEAEADRLRNKKRKDYEASRNISTASQQGSSTAAAHVTDADDEGEETEVEGEEAAKMRASISSFGSVGDEDSALLRDASATSSCRPKDDFQEVTAPATQASIGAASSTGLRPPTVGQISARQRPVSADLGSASEFSTDSEWEKVSSSGHK
ncbi:Pkr1-domain-containing protein [Polychaeton citri CBS 116435]|uniref:Pkr1-domain-containing protein n=1 Tax=Polychaeton citri CBS 116435 TaxID=1314669 RepID=A0A9P4QCY5_9PEZI|nr:Pkr1-domain-containing protein [Polychaeton citri CBS 116435]